VRIWEQIGTWRGEEKMADEDEDYDGIGELTPDFEFVDNIFVKIANKEKKKGSQSLTDEQQVLATVWQVAGIVENSGLFSFFELRFDVDDVIRAYETVGLREPAAVLKRAIAEFPNSMPPPNSTKLMDFMEEHEDVFDSLSNQFLRAEKNLDKVLVSYIQQHETAFKEFME
jgi:hypothetical protein